VSYGGWTFGGDGGVGRLDDISWSLINHALAFSREAAACGEALGDFDL
jgi:hypothetical protein